MDSWKGKRIAVLGVSVEGRDTVEYFLRHEASVTCCDRRSASDLADAMPSLEARGVAFHLGPEYLSALSEFDLVVRTPGMSLRLPELQPVIAAGKLTSQTKLVFDVCPARIIGVTGTKGKGTTSTLIAGMLEAAGKKVYLGGNVGVPLLAQVDRMESTDWVVFELSSFQLEDVEKSPHIAVVLRITQEHLANQDVNATNFHVSREAYVEAKRPIVRYQKMGDVAVVNAGDQTSLSFADLTPATVRTFSRYGSADAYVENHAVYLLENGVREKICDASEIVLRGDHNLENIAAAALAARAAGVSVGDIGKTARSFRGLVHRLESCGVVGGVEYFDDSFSTVPETTVAAVDAFDGPITLILGGSDKGSDYREMAEHLAGLDRVKNILLIGQMATVIGSALEKAGYRGHIMAGGNSMAEIVEKAKEVSSPGYVVILSPACASFGMFKNYKERGDQFKHVVSALA